MTRDVELLNEDSDEESTGSGSILW
jgi:hypothetical protein